MKKIPYSTQWIAQEDIKAVQSILKSAYLTQGPMVEVFEKAVATRCGVKYAVAVNSGTSALHIACLAAGIKKGDEVITSPITFVASANCVLYCGGKPIFADIHRGTININPKEIRKKINSKTKAIIPVHFAGHPANMKEIYKLEKKYNLAVIEDACHAFGAEYCGLKIGACSFSDITVLSFHAVKHITTGEGGMALTNKEGVYRQLLKLRSHGITRDRNQLVSKNKSAWFYEMQNLGFNYRLTDFQCALGVKQLSKLGKFVSRRRKIAACYNKAFKKVNGIITPPEKRGMKSSWHLYFIKVKRNRDRIFEYLREKGIGVNIHYIPVYWQPYYRKLGYRNGLCKKAEEYYRQTITLPLYPKMTDADIKYVIKIVKEAVKQNYKKQNNESTIN